MLYRSLGWQRIALTALGVNYRVGWVGIGDNVINVSYRPLKPHSNLA
jgi:hypothetical protein